MLKQLALTAALVLSLSACTTVVNVNSDVNFSATSKDTVTKEEVYVPDTTEKEPLFDAQGLADALIPTEEVSE